MLASLQDRCPQYTVEFFNAAQPMIETIKGSYRNGTVELLEPAPTPTTTGSAGIPASG